MIKWIKKQFTRPMKHQYVEAKGVDMNVHIVNMGITERRKEDVTFCRFCAKPSGMRLFFLTDLWDRKDWVRCENSDVRSTWGEFLLRQYNVLEPDQSYFWVEEKEPSPDAELGNLILRKN